MVTGVLTDNPGHRSVAEGAPLGSLTGNELANRFYCWLGLSGTSYVCTVFRAGEEEALASFNRAAIIGVAQRDEVRRPVCVLQPEDLTNESVRRVAAVSLGVNEWHAHFSEDRRQLAADIGCAAD